jgi:hypothetical protein
MADDLCGMHVGCDVAWASALIEAKRLDQSALCPSELAVVIEVGAKKIG